jgi:hypothetical protein
MNVAVNLYHGASARPDFISPEVLTSFRAALGECMEGVPHSIRESLIFVFMLVVLRVLLRNQWLAAAAFLAIWTSLSVLNGAAPVYIAADFLVYASIAFTVLRFGVLALAAAMCIDSVINEIPFTLNVSVWYFGLSVMMAVAVIVLVCWAFREAVRGQKLLRDEIFG